VGRQNAQVAQAEQAVSQPDELDLEQAAALHKTIPPAVAPEMAAPVSGGGSLGAQPEVPDELTLEQAVQMQSRGDGVVESGNIDLNARAVVKNPDGSFSTEQSFSVNMDGKEVLLPRVSPTGRVMSQEEAVQEYLRTGKHLGKFESPDAANSYADHLHKRQGQSYDPETGRPLTPGSPLYDVRQDPKYQYIAPTDASIQAPEVPVVVKQQGPSWVDKYPMLKMLQENPSALLGASWMNPQSLLDPTSVLSAGAGMAEVAVAGMFDLVVPGLLAADAAGATLAVGATDLYESLFQGYQSQGGVDLVDTFNKEFAEKMHKFSTAVPYAPETPTGQAIYDTIGQLFTEAVHAAGDLSYKVSGEPLAGAAAQTTAALVALALGTKMGKFGERTKPAAPAAPGEIVQPPVQKLDAALMTEDWRYTMNALDASGIGRISLERARTPAETAAALLNHKLGLTPEQGVQYTTREKFLMLLEQVDQGKEMTQSYKADLADVFDVQVEALTKIWETIPEVSTPSKLERINAGSIEAPTRPESPRAAPFRYRRITAPDAWSLELEQPVATALRPLGEIFREQAGALFVDRDTVIGADLGAPSDLTGIVKVFRGLVGSGQIKPGDWVTNDFKIAADYAKQRAGGALAPGEITQGGGSIVELDVPAGDLVKVHPGGYLYAPAGTDLSSVIRYVASDGTKVTFGDMLQQGINPEMNVHISERNQRMGGPGKKQGGALGPRQPIADNSKLAKIEALYDLSQAALRDSEKATAAKVARSFKNQVFDHSGELKASLLDENSVAGQTAINKYNVINGASARAQQRYKGFVANVYGGLARQDVRHLDILIDSRRKIQLDDYKGEGSTKRAGGLTGSDYRDALLALRDKVGQEKFDALQDRANKYFGVYKMLLAEQLEAGMISEASFNKLVRFEYSPTQYLEIVDPPPLDTTPGGAPVTVRESGIERWRGGADLVNNMNSRELLAEHIGRMERRMAKNTANQALAAFAKDTPGNGIVKQATVVRDGKGEITEVRNPERWQQISYFEGGKRQVLLMEPQMAAQWSASPYEMGALTANMFRIASGQALLKPLATTYNPSFVIAGVPMDLAHTWLSSGAYSTLLPKAMLEMGLDIAAVLPDAIKKGERFQAYVNEGGGFNFLTHQGKDFLQTRKGMHEVMDPKWGGVKQALSYVNETAEIAVRLAHRERLLKEGMSPEDATAAARDRLDYSQGGPMIKAADTIVPYLNVAVQAYYKVARQAKADPVQFAAKVGQVYLATQAVNLMNAVQNPETWKQVPANDKVNNIIITTPHFVLDPNGNKRYMYFKIRTDAVLAPVLATGAAATDAFVSQGKAPPSDLLRKTMSTFPGAMPPTLAAWASYTSNHDFWADKQIWSGANVSPGMEYTSLGRGEPTPEVLKWLGTAGISPDRLGVAMRNLVPNNDYLQLAGGAWKAIMQDTDDFTKAMSTEQMLSRQPGIRRVMSLTHPAVAELEGLVANEQQVNDQHKKESDALSDMAFKVRQGTLSEDAVKAWLKNQAPERQAELMQSYQVTQQLDKVYRKGSVPEGMPSKSWWTRSARMPAEARAAAFVERYSDADAETRQRLNKLAVQLPGYAGEEFQKWRFRYMKEKGLH
jgi:hypothetical protein